MEVLYLFLMARGIRRVAKTDRYVLPLQMATIVTWCLVEASLLWLGLRLWGERFGVFVRSILPQVVLPPFDFWIFASLVWLIAFAFAALVASLFYFLAASDLLE